ncbi:hypothetical protein [Actinobacillus capsulatus]|uniref:hypothetical protein n=1 Tax=Actinobacillus capsulatus TaxID=717 RepID=UPI0003699D4D|nr:hypothetical protein [Actinobacillus capsulatus]
MTSEVEKDFITIINVDFTGGDFTKYDRGITVLNGKNSFNQARIEDGQADVADVKSLGNTAGVWPMLEGAC